MKPVLQTRFEPGQGNCLNACVASILELPLGGDGVPEAKDELRGWLLARDLGIVWVRRAPGAISLAGFDSYCIGSGKSPRHPSVDHAIVMREWAEVHDPHPSRDFVAGPIKELGFVVRMGFPR